MRFTLFSAPLRGKKWIVDDYSYLYPKGRLRAAKVSNYKQSQMLILDDTSHYVIISTMQIITKLNTSPNSYLTARTALNISNKEMTGDWNFYNYFLSDPHEYYIEQTKNTPWNEQGIIEVSATLNKYNIFSENPNSDKTYASNHYRALADLFFNRIKRNKPLKSLFFNINDWLNTQNEKHTLYKQYLSILANSEIDNWINHEAKH